jgi:putative peptide zinc metalloprotease protein
MFMMVSIALLVASRFFVVGVILAVWAMATMLILPVGKKLNYLFLSPRLASHRQRAVFSSAAIVALLAGMLLWWPAPSSTRAEGVIWAPEQAQVRAAVDGFVAKVVARPHQQVHRGDILIECEDPELAARARVLQAQLAELDARYKAAILSRRVQAEVINEQKGHVADALRLALRHQAELHVRSPADGTFIMQDAQNAQGRYAQRGETLAYVTDRAATTVRVVVPQAEGDRVRKRTRRVEIRPADRIDHAIPARIEREVPAATDELPSMTLSLQGGGKIGLDPGKPGDSKAIEKLFVLDLQVPPGEQPNFLGGRIYVRFEHEPEPLAEQWYREIRRAFLKKFNV